MKFFKNSFTDFLVKGIVFYILWEVLYKNAIQYSAFDHYVVDKIANISTLVLSWFYSNVHIEPIGKIFVNGKYTVLVAPDCNGMDFLGAFFCFLLAFPATIKAKLIFGTIMTLVIQTFNVIRIVLLAVTVTHFEQWFEFNHHYLFNSVIYVIMIASILFWVKNYATTKDTSTSEV